MIDSPLPVCTLTLYDRAMCGHDPGTGHPERPERLQAIEAVLQEHGGDTLELESPPEVTREAIERVHHGAHVQRVFDLQDTYSALDADTHVSPGSLRAALLAAGAATTAVDALCTGQARNAFALVRPPGHHAEADRAMGFCLFNNVAIAAAHARAAHGIDKILIIDWDVHHGNGTQHLFYEDPNTLFFSVHQHPFYPGTGGLQHSGSGAGQGFNVNVPLRGEATDADYRLVFSDILTPIAEAFAPELVLVSAGFDAHRADPLGGMLLSAEGFGDLCAAVEAIADRHAGGKLGLLLEGGYDLEGLARSALCCLQVLAGTAAPGVAGARTAQAEAEIRAAIAHHRAHWPTLR